MPVILPTFITPIWLSGLVTVPFIWWLHHYRRLGSSTTVSAVWLWQGNAISQGGHMQRSLIDPSWRIRALAATMLVIGLAEPLWLTQSPRAIEIWFDDSISMQTLENGTTRTTLAVDAILDMLPINSHNEVTLHSLVNASRSLTLDTRQRLMWRSSIEKWIRPGGQLILPTPLQMNTDNEHWLVSDGADPFLGTWLKKVRFSRIVQVGEHTENVALTHLSLRPSLTRAETYRGLLIVHNLGHETATRHIEITANQQTVKTFDISMPAGKDINLSFRLNNLQDGKISVVITPPDALRIDDDLTLETAPGGKISATLDATCGPHLRKAVRAHPILRFIERLQQPTIVISCEEKQPHSGGELLWIHTSQVSNPLHAGSLRDTPLWQQGAGPLQKLILNPRWLRQFDIENDIQINDNNKSVKKHGTPLLIAGGAPLIIDYQPTQALIEVRLDLESPLFVIRPEYPLLIAGLIDGLLKRSSLDTIWQTGRSPQQSITAPSNIAIAHRSFNTDEHRIGQDLSFFFILAAGLLLLLDFMRFHIRPLPMTPTRHWGHS